MPNCLTWKYLSQSKGLMTMERSFFLILKKVEEKHLELPLTHLP